jgi:hypothetical protein
LIGEFYEGHFNVGHLANGGSDDKTDNPLTHLILVSAGTGFTPMPKLLQYFVAYVNETVTKRNIKLPSSATLLCFNKTTKDIIWKELSYNISY